MATSAPQINGTATEINGSAPAAGAPALARSLAEALAAFQAEVPTFRKSKTARVQTKTGGTYTYRYADLGDIVPLIGPLLGKHGLSWSAKPRRGADGDWTLHYVLRHVCGESDEGEMPLLVERDCKIQELGSAITYIRRYAMTAQLNLATDEDDDGQAANASKVANGSPVSAQPSPRPVAVPAKPSERPAAANDIRRIEGLAADADMTDAELANVILFAAGEQPRVWHQESAAASTLKRLLDRLPARLVDQVLDGIARNAEPGR
jgi:hypothetical protein